MSDFDPLDMERRLVAMRRRRFSRDEDEQNALFAARASQDYGNAARSNANAPIPVETSDPSRALPFVGPGAPADRSSLAEEEWNFSRPGNASGGSGKTAAAASGAPARPEKRAASSSPGGAAVLRSAGATKAGLATGSQAAVVKLASYGAGSVRAGALLNYQSHKGELALEREDGALVFGKQAVGDLAAQWRDEADGREPSNDVLSFTLTLSTEAPTPKHVREVLGDALKGHAFAWRMEETQIHVVMVAASAERGDSGKLERIYPNQKSLAGLHDRIDGALNIETSRSEARWAHGVEGATAELASLTKGGQIATETYGGLAVDEVAGRLFLQRTRVAADAKAKGFNSNLELAKSWERGMRSQGRRDFAHVILSAKAGTDKEAFMDAARATLAKEFEGHEYVFVMHTNRQHIHVHAAVRLTNAEGKKIDPRIADFSRWRSTLAEEARERNIPMESVRRFDQAHAPGYKLKDVNMVERGIAPEAARRRIERVKNKEIHRPDASRGPPPRRRGRAPVEQSWRAKGLSRPAPAGRGRNAALPGRARRRRRRLAQDHDVHQRARDRRADRAKGREPSCLSRRSGVSSCRGSTSPQSARNDVRRSCRAWLLEPGGRPDRQRGDPSVPAAGRGGARAHFAPGKFY